jgi:hypothetical protein
MRPVSWWTGTGMNDAGPVVRLSVSLRPDEVPYGIGLALAFVHLASFPAQSAQESSRDFNSIRNAF